MCIVHSQDEAEQELAHVGDGAVGEEERVEVVTVDQVQGVGRHHVLP